jgi:hypothetical protein
MNKIIFTMTLMLMVISTSMEISAQTIKTNTDKKENITDRNKSYETMKLFRDFPTWKADTSHPQ